MAYEWFLVEDTVGADIRFVINRPTIMQQLWGMIGLLVSFPGAMIKTLTKAT